MPSHLCWQVLRSSLALSNYLKEKYDAIQHSTSVHFRHDEVTANNKKLSVKEAYVDPDFYNIFGFKLISGSPAIRPQTVVLTKETAERFFGKKIELTRLSLTELYGD